MKYYTELTNLEFCIIELEGIVGLADAITTACEEQDRKRLYGALYNVTSQLEKLEVSLRDRFENLFDTIRDDDEEMSRKSKRKAKSIRKNSQ